MEADGRERRPSQQELITEEQKAPVPTTVVPIREEFRVRRLWFFHHDVRAFTTSVCDTSVCAYGSYMCVHVVVICVCVW